MGRQIGYWWDFCHHDDGQMTVIVECDHPKAAGRTLGEFPEIAPAMRLIEELKSGRVSMHELLKDVTHGH